MTQWNQQVDGPPPVEVARRFSDDLAAAIVKYRANPTHENEEAIRLACISQETAPAATREVINERRARIAALLEDLRSEVKGLSEDLALPAWRQDPNSTYRPATLSVARRRARPTLKALELLEDLGDIAASEHGHVNRDQPRPTLTVKDLAQRPRISRVPEYAAGEPGHESADPTGRVVGGREAA